MPSTLHEPQCDEKSVVIYFSRRSSQLYIFVVLQTYLFLFFQIPTSLRRKSSVASTLRLISSPEALYGRVAKTLLGLHSWIESKSLAGVTMNFPVRRKSRASTSALSVLNPATAICDHLNPGTINHQEAIHRSR